MRRCRPAAAPPPGQRTRPGAAPTLYCERMDKPFLEALAAGGLVGDGAMGSLLYERGIYVNRNFDEVNLSQPELVYLIHREYLLAGAHVLESNSYGANRVRLARHGLAERVE